MTIQALLISYKAAPGGSYSMTMTAGKATGDDFFGYDTGTFDVFGSIDHQPVSGQTLQFFIDFGGGSGNISFAGNIVATLSGLKVWVAGVQYPFDDFDWMLSSGNTVGQWASAGPTFTNGGVYFVEIK